LANFKITNNYIYFYQTKNDSEWENRTEFGFNDKILKLVDLEQNTEYKIRAGIVETGGISLENEETSFRTRKCIPIGEIKL